MYLNFFLASVIEIPANYVGIWCIGRLVARLLVVFGGKVWHKILRENLVLVKKSQV